VQLFGLSISEAPASVWIESIHPEDRDRVAAGFAEALQGAPYDTEYRLVPHHTTRWVRAKAKLLPDPQGPRLVGIVEDISERRRTEDFLRQTSETIRLTAERLRLAQSAGRTAIFEWTLTDGSITWTDSELAYGRTSSEIGHVDKVFALIHPDDITQVTKCLQPALDGTGEFSAEFRVLWPDGTTHWLQGFGKPVTRPDGKVTCIVGFNIDITERKRAEETLLRTEKLAAVGRLASSIAHEINNPLEAVTNLLYLARHSETLQQAHPFLETADLELRRAAAITNQTLRFHRQATRPTEVTFTELVTGIFTGQHSRLRNAGITIQQRDRSTAPVLCFEGEIRQVLTNLIGNAIDSMHGLGGTLYLRGRTTQDLITGKPGLTITIADTGTGIPEDARTRLFDAFFTTKGIGGTGLGLWISKEILDRHNGTLHLRTSRGPAQHGTVFTVFLPASSTIQSASPAIADSQRLTLQ
jgi:PAS domain S-box-containing protein